MLKLWWGIDLRNDAIIGENCDHVCVQKRNGTAKRPEEFIVATSTTMVRSSIEYLVSASVAGSLCLGQSHLVAVRPQCEHWNYEVVI